MTYTWLALVFLVVAAVVAATAVRRGRRAPRLGALAITTVVLFVLTAVFDTIMIGAGFFTFGDGHVLGFTVGLAPIEDFSYPLAGVILLPALWTALRTRTSRPARRETPS